MIERFSSSLVVQLYCIRMVLKRDWDTSGREIRDKLVEGGKKKEWQPSGAEFFFIKTRCRTVASSFTSRRLRAVLSPPPRLRSETSTKSSSRFSSCKKKNRPCRMSCAINSATWQETERDRERKKTGINQFELVNSRWSN